VVIIVIPNVARVALYTQICCIIGIVGAYINAGDSNRFGVAYIVDNLQLVAVGFLNFQVVDITVLIQVEVVDAVCRVINRLFKRCRVGAGFYKLRQLVYIKTRSGIVFDGYIVLLRAVLVARGGHKY